MSYKGVKLEEIQTQSFLHSWQYELRCNQGAEAHPGIMLGQDALLGFCQPLRACQSLGLLPGRPKRQMLPFAEPQQPQHPDCPHIIFVQVQGAGGLLAVAHGRDLWGGVPQGVGGAL